MPKLRPCLTCGALTTAASYCPRHGKRRDGSTRQWRRLRELVLARDQYTCQGCGQPAEHVDHIIPVAQGGRDLPENCQALCARCNLAKGDR